jgi:hypothetical protein
MKTSSRAGLEEQAIERLYSTLPSVDFSVDVLASNPSDLAVLPFADPEWSDLGEPGRVRALLEKRGIVPN